MAAVLHSPQIHLSAHNSSPESDENDVEQPNPGNPLRLKIMDFKFERTLGMGSFGRVKCGVCSKDGERYAVKFMKKRDIVKMKQADHINGERRIMLKLPHPMIVSMLGAFKDERFVYIAMELVTGGELFTHLRKARRFTDEQARFYGSQIASVFEFMHRLHIVHRDLKPENILICADGYCKLTDFGFAKIIEPGCRTYTLCGTPEYIAPEVLLNKGHGKPVDWWTLGILIYEMIVGQPPFCDDEPLGIYQKILAGKIYFPKIVEKNAKSLIKKLLMADLSKRLGNLKNGSMDVLKHKWFSSVDLDKLYRKELPTPFSPPMKSASDLSNFEVIDENDTLPPVLPASQDPFKDW